MGTVYDAVFSCGAIRPTRKMGEVASLLVQTEYYISVLNARLLGNSFYKPFQSIYRYSGYYPVMQTVIETLAEGYRASEEKFCRPLFRALFWGPNELAFSTLCNLSLKLSRRIRQIREVFCTEDAWPNIVRLYGLVLDEQDQLAFIKHIFSSVTLKNPSREQENFYLKIFEESKNFLCGPLAEVFTFYFYRRAKANELKDKKLQAKILSKQMAEKIFLAYVESIENGNSLRNDNFSCKVSLLVKNLVDDHPCIFRWNEDFGISCYRRNLGKYSRALATGPLDKKFIFHFVAAFPFFVTKNLVNELFSLFESGIFQNYILIMFNSIFYSEFSKRGLQLLDKDKFLCLLLHDTEKKVNLVAADSEAVRNDLLKPNPLIVLRITLYYKLLNLHCKFNLKSFSSISAVRARVCDSLLSEAIMYFTYDPYNSFNLEFTNFSELFEDSRACAIKFMLNPEGAFNFCLYFHQKHLEGLRRHESSTLGVKLPNFISYENYVGYIISYVINKIFNGKMDEYRKSKFGRCFIKLEEKIQSHEYAEAITRIKSQLIRRRRE